MGFLEKNTRKQMNKHWKDRFWDKVTKTETCWLFNSAINKKGYGTFWLDGRANQAHRISWILANSDIPFGLSIDHLCRIKNCVNPDHMEVVTLQENSHRKVVEPKTVCIRGHKLEGYNLVIPKDGRRRCRTCRVAATQKYRMNESYAEQEDGD